MAPATVRRAPYKDFLQPALHRRFSSAATLLLAFSYLVAIFQGRLDSFVWSWFPIGPVGFRTVFVFTSALAVIILRISQYHAGSRVSTSPLQNALSSVCTIQFLEAWLSYGFSSTVFGLVYLWAVGERGDMNWIKVSSGDRARLNEKPVFVFFYLLVSAALQAFLHIASDQDSIELGTTKIKAEGSNKEMTASPSPLSPILSRIPAVGIDAVTKAFSSWCLANVLYHSVFRSIVWGWAMTFFRPFYNLPKTNMLPSEGVFRLPVIWNCIWSGVLLMTIWSLGNMAFSVFMVREPLKNGKPLSSESKDANGTLLNGLKSKKLPIRCFAFWELAYIARQFEARRKAIFEDIDRKDGPMWSQVYVLCFDVVKALEKRIDDYGKPPPPPAAVQPEPAPEQKYRTSAPPKDDPIFQKRLTAPSRRGELEKAVGQAARDPGNTPLSQLSPRAVKTLRHARDKILTKEQQEALTSPKVTGQFQAWALSLVQNDYVGWIFRSDFQRRFTAAVLGTPYSEASHHINAIDSLSLLAVHSLTEDKFGNVARDIATIVRTFTVVIRKLEAFKTSFPTHWTDVEGRKDAPDVDAVLAALKRGLSDVVQEFEPYCQDLRLTRTDIRLAKEASAQTQNSGPKVEEKAEKADRKTVEERPEMAQVRQ